MYRECSLKCPINKNGKCLSGNAHKSDFDLECREREKITDLYRRREINIKGKE